MVLNTETRFSEVSLSFKNCLYFITLHTIDIFFLLSDGWAWAICH